MNRLLATCLAVGIGAVVSAEARQSAVRPSAAIEDMLWWLPADTETLMVQQRSAPPMRGLVHDALLSDEIDVGDSGLMAAAKPHLQGARLKLTLEGSRMTSPRHTVLDRPQLVDVERRRLLLRLDAINALALCRRASGLQSV